MRSLCVFFGLHSDVNDAHRAGANRLQKQTNYSIRLLHIVKDQDRAQRRGSHHTDQSEKITSFGPFRISYRHPPNYITLFVPTSIHYELHEIASHFFDSLRIIYVIFYLAHCGRVVWWSVLTPEHSP